MKPIVIDGANAVFKAPEGMENCCDIIVRREEAPDGVVSSYLELELTPEERKSIAEGGTLIVGQVCSGWVPISVQTKTIDGQIVGVGIDA